MTTIRWGILGCGNVCEVKSGPGLQKADGSDLVAVMRRNGALAADYAKRHGVPRWYDDADALIGDEAVDAVYIATPPSSHLELTRRVAAAGKPVYVEKPIAATSAEAEQMTHICEEAGVPLFVAYYRRRLPVFMQVEHWLREEAIGQVRFVSIRLFGSPSQADLSGAGSGWRIQSDVAGKGGYFHDLGCHQLDVLDYLLGPIEAVDGQSGNQSGLYDCEDAVTAAWRHAGGALGSGLWVFTAYEGSSTEEIEIVGSEGRISCSAFELDRPLRLERSGGHVEETTIEPPAHVQQPLIQSVVDALRGRGTCPSTGVSALRTAQVMDRILGVM
jgi:1,5-anhydro-D-fructose reductase (1,5-anhydro-D-mannitol-forming)